MTRAAVIAILAFIIGGLIGAGLTYRFANCQTKEVVFKLQAPNN